MTTINLAPGLSIPVHLANRHGLITGPSGTGKSYSLMRLAEQFSFAGTSVFLADVKGDLGIMARTAPVSFLCPYGTAGERFGASVQAIGADLMSRALELTDAQAGTLELAFAFAASLGADMRTKADLRIILTMMIRNRANLVDMGQVSPASVGVIQRALLRLDDDVLSPETFDTGRLLIPGQVNILRSARIVNESPRMYAALLMRVLTDLDRRLPEVGDRPVPRLAFFFDEAHLLFNDAPVPLVNRIERTIRLIRSKGVGVYFASQSIRDVPEIIRDQCAHRIEHDRAHGVGRANVSTLKPDGMPLPPRVVSITAPACHGAPAVEAETIPTPIGTARAPAPVLGQSGEPEGLSGAVASYVVTALVLMSAAYGTLAFVGIPVKTALFLIVGAVIAAFVGPLFVPHHRRRH